MTANEEAARAGKALAAVGGRQLVLSDSRRRTWCGESELLSLARHHGGERGPRGWGEEGYRGVLLRQPGEFVAAFAPAELAGSLCVRSPRQQ